MISRELTQLHVDSPQPLVSVVMPCLNEEDAIAHCINKIQSVFSKSQITGEIVVCDNGSTDQSVAIAESMGVKVVHQPLRGYGNAYLKGFASAKGEYFIMGDADDTYDFNLIPQFLDFLCNQGYDFVTGSRYLERGDQHITGLHRYFGNPLLTSILNFLFGTSYTDVYCGLRGFTRSAYEKIQPVSAGMEFNLELAINAGLANLKIAETPIYLHPRRGLSKLRTFRDGWRSLRMMLLYCPNKVFIWPGFSLFLLGITIHLITLIGLIQIEGRPLGMVTSIFGTIFSVVGFEILSLGLHAKTYSWSRRFDEDNFFIKKFYQSFKLETGLLGGLIMISSGFLILLKLVIEWFNTNLFPLAHPEQASFAATLIVVGFSCMFTSLFISSMSIKKGFG